MSRAELHQMADSIVEAVERMFDTRLPAAGGRGAHRPHEDHHREESGDENSGFGHGFEHFGRGRGGHGGGRRADFDNQRGGRRAYGRRAHGRHVRFDDEEFENHHEDEGSDDNENPFGRDGRFERRRDHHRRAEFEVRDHHHGRRNRDDPDNIARVKLRIPKFTGKENADEFLEWAEQCDQIFRVHNLSDQRRVNLASVEFSGYALTWWN